MQDRADARGLSGQVRPTCTTARPDSRNRHRMRGWLIAVTASALLWGGIIWVAWAMVRALT